MTNKLSADSLKYFVEFINAVLHSRAVKYFANSTVRLSVNPAIVAFPYERSVSVSLNGPSGGLLLQIHFDVEVSVLMASAAFGNDREEVSDDEAAEFLLEFANLVAGFLRGSLESVDIEIMRLIPYVQIGTALREEEQVAELEIDDHVIAYSFLVDPHKLDVFERAAPRLQALTQAELSAASSSDADGDIEFL